MRLVTRVLGRFASAFMRFVTRVHGRLAMRFDVASAFMRLGFFWSAFIILGPAFWACRDRGLLEAFLGSVLEVLILPIAYWASSDMSALFGFTAVAASTVIAFILRASCWA